MATKTFKIGLSATDKQNMAQDILEQVEEMLFEEYDSTKTYNIGDYCVYSGALYRCKVDNTTGTWNSSNWDSATLQDLVDDVNDAVASVNGKANIIDLENGTLVVAKSLTAKQLENVSDESGSTQDAPFNFQATGTDNNTTETPTAPVAKHLELRGNTVAWNQLIDGTTPTSTTTNDLTITNNGDGSFTITGTANADTNITFKSSTWTLNHKYLIKGIGTSGSLSTYYWYDSYYSMFSSGSDFIFKPTNSAYTIMRISLRILNGVQVNLTIYPQLIDLTLLGKEYDSALAFNRDYPLPYYSYNAGELKSASSSKLITIGCNQLNELNTFIKVIAGQTYELSGVSAGGYIQEYDYEQNLIKTSSEIISTTQITLTNNTHYVKVQATTYSNAMFRLYWNESHDFVEYVKHEYTLPAVSLKSAGNAYDELKADGTLITRIGSVDLSTLDFYNEDSVAGRWRCDSLTSVIKGSESASVLGNIVCNKYASVSWTQAFNGTIGISINSSGSIRIYDTSITQASDITGTLYYELATPTETTDETKAFTENIEVDDFGTMEFFPASGNVESASNPIVPQGNQFFYPADYVLLIDDLNNYLNENEADTTDLVLRKELLPKLPNNSEDGTYTLKATKSGSTITYAWVKDE